MRKQPTQARSKERVERILNATEALIIEGGGVSGLTVHEIAAKAKVPVGSLYQYFTNRDEVLQALCDKHYRTLAALAKDCFTDIKTIPDFTRDVRKALTICWDYTRDNASYRLLFFDVQAWEVMREADWQDTFMNAQTMTGILQKLLPMLEEKQLLALCVLIGDTASNTARLAARFPDIQEELYEEFIEMVENRIFALLKNNAALERTPAKSAAQPA